jgi:hypothetical protein
MTRDLRVKMSRNQARTFATTARCALPAVDFRDSIVYRDPDMRREAMKASLRMPDGRRKYVPMGGR